MSHSVKLDAVFLIILCTTLLSCKQNKKTVFTDQDTMITVEKGIEFVIKLPAKYDEGYVWMEKTPIDTHYLQLKLIDHKKEQKDRINHFEYWYFNAKKEGETRINLKQYIHPRKNTEIDSISFLVLIK